MSTLSRKIGFSITLALALWVVVELIVSVVFSAQLAEWAAPSVEIDDEAPTMPGNPYLLYEYRPGVHQERGVAVTINSLGLRGDEPVIPKPNNQLRFMTTGDSSVFGFGVADAEVFSAVAADMFGDNVEDINAAIPGYSTYQSINLLRLRALQTEPDLFVIANIWSDNNFGDRVDRDLLAAYETYEESASGNLRRVLAKSAIFRILDWNLRVQPATSRVDDYVQKTGWLRQSGPQIGVRRVEINDYATNLETLVSIASEVGAEVVFMMLANNEDLDEPGPGKAWDPYRQVIRDTASRHGAPIIDVPTLFQESGLSRDQLFLDEMHPTTAGHRIMGESLGSLLKGAEWDLGGSVMTAPAGGAMPTYDDPYVQGTEASVSPMGSGDPNPSGGDPSGSPGEPQPMGNQIAGEVVYDDYEGGIIQIECMAGDSGAQPTVLGSARLSDGPGRFSLDVRDAETVVLRAYLDVDGDGPDADDARFDLTRILIDVSDDGSQSLLVDLGELTVEPGEAD